MTEVNKRLPAIHFHPILYLFFIIAFFTGMFVEMLIIFMIVFIHECGHMFMAMFYKWRIRSVMLWIFGGVMDTDEYGNRSVKEEFFVTIAGPFQHLLIYIFVQLVGVHLFSETIINDVLFYNLVIVLFNLLPISPLDGGKLIHLLMSLYMPFKRAHTAIIVVSALFVLCVMVIMFMYKPFTLSAFCLLLFLFIENISDWRKRYYVFLRFLLRRLERREPYKKKQRIYVVEHERLIDMFRKLYRNREHELHFQNHNVYFSERKCLDFYFSGKVHNPQGKDLLRDEAT